MGEGRDELDIQGSEPARFETRQLQASWLNEFGTQVGTVMAGLETLRQEVLSPTAFTQTRRDTNSGFLAIKESWRGQRLEASVRLHFPDAQHLTISPAPLRGIVRALLRQNS